jgi:hypothetical protein
VGTVTVSQYLQSIFISTGSVDITSSSQSRLNIYQVMGVPEIWLYSRQGLTILQLDRGEYIECEHSSIFTQISAAMLENLLERGQQSPNHNILISELRMWLRDRNNML